MRIVKFKGKTETAVMKQIEKEYQNNAVVLSTQKEEIAGPFKWLKSPRIVVTVAIKEESDQLVEEASSNQSFKVATLREEPQHKEEDSYEAIMALREEMGRLSEEIEELRKTPPTQVVVTKTETDEMSSINNIKEAKLMKCIKDKLMYLGLKNEVCEALFEDIHEEESEVVIRKLYDALEEQLIEKEEEAFPQIIFFIGSTGVGKTTTLAKLTAKYVLEEQKKVVLFTSDTYRIAAVEQLKTYADILGVEIEIIYDESELPKYIEKWKHMDHILIDTAGRSHKNEEQVTELKGLMQQIKDKQVFLVLSANTAGRDVGKIVEIYEKAEKEFDLIITKLDETDEIGNVVNIGYYAKKPIAYLTNGQNVPADIEAFNKQKYITELLGRLNDE